MSLYKLRSLIASGDETVLPSFGPRDVHSPGCEPTVLEQAEWIMFSGFRSPTGISSIVDVFDGLNKNVHDAYVFVTWCPRGESVRFLFVLD